VYLDRLKEILGASPKQKAKMKKGNRKSAPKPMYDDEMDQSDEMDEDIEQKPSEEKEKPSDQDSFAKLKKIADPQLLLIREDDNYASFLQEPLTSEDLGKCLELTAKEGFKAWIVGKAQQDGLKAQLDALSIKSELVALPKGAADLENPFKDINITLDAEPESLKEALAEAWKRLVPKKEAEDASSVEPLKPADTDAIQKEEGIEDLEPSSELKDKQEATNDIIFHKSATDSQGSASLDKLVEMIKNGELTGDDLVFLDQLNEDGEPVGFLPIGETSLSEHLQGEDKAEDSPEAKSEKSEQWLMKKLDKMTAPSLILIDKRPPPEPKEGEEKTTGWHDIATEFMAEMSDEMVQCLELENTDEYLALLCGTTELTDQIAGELKSSNFTRHTESPLGKLWLSKDEAEEDAGKPEEGKEEPELDQYLNRNPFKAVSPLPGYGQKKMATMLASAWEYYWDIWKRAADKEIAKNKPKPEKKGRGAIDKIKKLKAPMLLVVIVDEDKAGAYASTIEGLQDTIGHYVLLAETPTHKGWIIESQDEAATGFRKALSEVPCQQEEYYFTAAEGEDKKKKKKEDSDLGTSLEDLEDSRFTQVQSYYTEEYRSFVLSSAADYGREKIRSYILAADAISGKELVKIENPFDTLTDHDKIHSGLLAELKGAWEAEKKSKDEEDDLVGGSKTTSVKLNDIRRLTKPYILILNPRGDTANYEKVMADKSKMTELGRCIHFMESKVVKDGNHGLDLYFLNDSQVKKVAEELQKLKIQYSLMPAKEGFHEENMPFTGMQIDDKTFGKKIDDLTGYVNELNQFWSHLDDDSGQKVPAIEMSNKIPLDFLRFIDRKQREVKLYVGGRPAGAGSEDSMYALVSDYQEATDFTKLLKYLNLPSLFYRGLYETSDIPADFKKIDPETYTPSNALILEAKETFDPKEVIEPNEDNMDLFKVAAKGFDSEHMVRLNSQLEELNKVAEKSKLTGNWPKKMDEAKYTEEVKRIEDEIEKEAGSVKVTQLHLLHAYAKSILGNPTRNTGMYLVGKYIIGTYVVNFSKDFKRCILWGSPLKHVTVDKDSLLKQMPFVKKVITSHL